MTTTTAITTPAYARNKAGFPIVSCGRCAGTGHMPYSYAGGVCFKCIGTGYVLPKSKAGELAAEWNRIISAAREVDTTVRVDPQTGEITCQLKPGDQVRNICGMSAEEAKLVPWMTVERIEEGNDITGWGATGTVESGTWQLTSMSLDATIVYTDGSTRHAGILMSRKVDPALFELRDAMAAQARALHERALTARARKAAKA